MRLSEQFRPATWADLAGQEALARTVENLRRRGLGGSAYYLAGKSGTGKTSAARLLAAEVAGPFGVEESNAADLGVSDVRDMESKWQKTILPNGKPPRSGWAFIFNEAHLMRGAVVSRLLTTLEAIPPYALVIFTTTADDKALWPECSDRSPFLSRCIDLGFSQQGIAPALAECAVRNCRAAGILNGKPDSYYVSRALAYLAKNGTNLRTLYNAADAGYLTAKDNDE